MNINVSYLLIVSVIFFLPMSLSAVTFEDLAEVLHANKACPVIEEELSLPSIE